MALNPSARLAERTFRAGVPVLTQVAWTGGIVAMIVYCVLLAWLSPLPVQDLPNHLARAVAMSDLLFHGGERFGTTFEFHLQWIPYLLGDLILTVAVALFGTTGGAALWILLVFVSLPCAALFYLRCRGIGSDSRALMLWLTLYFATDWFFLIGFLSFRVAVAMSIATLGLAELLRPKWAHPLFALYVGAVILDYLMHLSPIVFLLAALGITALLRLHARATTLRAEVALLAPVLLVLAWHFIAGAGSRAPTDPPPGPYFWGTWSSKLARMGSEFFHFVPSVDLVLVFLLAACLFAWAGTPRVSQIRRPAVFEFLALAVTFLALYFVLPIGYSEAYYVDTRPLPLASFFFICACLELPRSHVASQALRGIPFAALRLSHVAPQTLRGIPFAAPRWPLGRRKPVAFLLAALLVSVHLTYLTHHFLAERNWTTQYRSVVAAVPPHGRVLPVYTHGGEGSVVPFFHVSGYISMDRAAVEPYVFAGNNGNPMKYFRYRKTLYEPPEDWYGNLPRPQLDWQAVAGDYDFLLVTKPYDPRVLQLPTRTVTENSSATLLAIVKQQRPAPASHGGRGQGEASSISP